MRNARRLLFAAIATAVLVASAVTLLPSGDSGSEQPGVEVAAVRNPLLAAREGSRESPGIVKSSDPISKGAPRVVSYPNGRDNDEVSETGANPVEPCRLVPRDEATAILGKAVQVSEEPLGPTCVYSLQSGDQVTLAVETTSLQSLRRHARQASRVQVGGRVGWCMRYESTSVGVALAGGRLLHVTGPCVAATSLAARALPRVPR